MRIASLSPAITEILFSLKLQEQIVCTDALSDYPEEAQSIARVINDNVYEHEADLVFTSTSAQDKLAQKLQGADFSVSHHNPQTINDIYEMVRNIGMILQVEKEAAAVVLQMQQGLKDVKRKSTLLPSRQGVYIEGCPQPWVKEIAHIAGLERVARESGAAIIVSNNGRIIDAAFLERAGPRLVEGARYLYGWAFENLH
jgi:ABC-type Fe3+-hydroxamate transport system substrate-binding protein